MTSWKNIHQDFTPELEKEWEEKGFTCEQTKEWANSLKGYFEVSDYNFCAWLRDKKKLTAETLNHGNLSELIDNYNLESWQKNIHWNFTLEAKEEWIDKGFSYEECRKWIKAGLKPKDYELVAYLRGKGHKLSEFNLKVLKEEYKSWVNTSKTVREYIDILYPQGKREKVKKLDMRYKDLEGELDLLEFVNLKQLICSGNRLTSLDVNGCNKLEMISCFKNKLVKLIYPINSKQLSFLDISYNDLHQDLAVFSRFTNLRKLVISNNLFFGSLKSLKNLTKLKSLGIDNTDIDRGLEYLSDSVETFRCSSTERPESRVSDIYEELQPFGFDLKNRANLKKWKSVKWDKKLDLVTSPLMPAQLLGETKQKSKFAELVKKVQKKEEKENKEKKLLDIDYIQKIDYNEIHFNNWPMNRRNELFFSKQLPTRLYNIKENKVEETRDNLNIKNYAILSYVWGNPNIKITEELEEKSWWKKQLTVSGNKSLWKAVLALETINKEKNKELIKKDNLNITEEELEEKLKNFKNPNTDINHIWIDQLCIKQGENEESKNDKENEIPKMRQYYSNSIITLIAVDDEVGNIDNVDLMDILSKIVNSEWFERSWTFQEGWLSKQTIFMFDDKLIDGRYIAGLWALNQSSYTNVGKYNSRSEFNKGTKKIATPVGWVYYRDGYEEKDKVEMTLNQALKAVKYRKRTLPIDGIYSILGLLPYGNEVKVNYNLTPEGALYEVMKKSVGNYLSLTEEKHYSEPVSWHGQGNSWMPKIDETGSTSIEGGAEIEGRGVSFHKKDLLLSNIDTYDITKVSNSIQKLEVGFEIEGGLYKKNIEIVKRASEIKTSEKLEESLLLKLLLNISGDEEAKKEIQWMIKEDKVKEIEKQSTELTLFGTKKALELVQEGKVLAVFDRREYTTNESFALIVEDMGREVKFWNVGAKYGVYRRLGLVELSGGEKLKGEGNDGIIIETPSFQSSGQENFFTEVKAKTGQLMEELTQVWQLAKIVGQGMKQQAQIEQPPITNNFFPSQ